MTVYAYCRVSTPKQKIERQIKNIQKNHPEIKLKDYYMDEWTGSNVDRPNWKKLEDKLKAGDMIVFDSVSRMSRQAKEGFDLYKRLYEKGIDLQFLKEPFIDTEKYRKPIVIKIPNIEDRRLTPLITGLKVTLMLLAQDQFIAAFEQVEKEVENLRQSTREGFTPEARRKISESKRGKTIVTKKSLEIKPKIKKLSKFFNGNFKDKEVIEFLNINRNTYYKYKKELKQEEIID